MSSSSLTVPAANVGGGQPADLDHVEVYAVTSERPVAPIDGAIAPGLTLVATLPVRPPPPPGERAPAAAAPVAPVAPGLAQGQHVTIREVLDAAAVTPTSVAPAEPARRRSTRGRHGCRRAGLASAGVGA